MRQDPPLSTGHWHSFHKMPQGIPGRSLLFLRPCPPVAITQASPSRALPLPRVVIMLMGSGHSGRALRILLISTLSACLPLPPSKLLPWWSSPFAFPATCSQQELQALRTKALLDPGPSSASAWSRWRPGQLRPWGRKSKQLTGRHTAPWGAREDVCRSDEGLAAWTGSSKRRLLTAVEE